MTANTVAKAPKMGPGINANLDEISSILAHHDNSLSVLGNRMSSVESTLASLGTKLDQVVHAITTAQARPRMELKDILQIVLMGSTLIGASVTAILWISGTTSSVEINAIKQNIASVAERSKIFYDDNASRVTRLSDEINVRQGNLRERLLHIEKYLLESQRARQDRTKPEPQLYISPDPLPGDEQYLPEHKSKKGSLDERNL